jgi:glycosyltransferase involved in cell wall biosynthesis
LTIRAYPYPCCMAASVTVVSVTRNDLAGIQQTLESVRDQEGTAIEHIVVDGASTDGTVEWLTSLEWPDGSLFTSGPDRGIYDAMNKGAERATGDLLVFMNGGDRFPRPYTAGEVVEDFDARRWDWAYGVTALLKADGTVSRIHQMAPFSKVRLGLGLAAVPHQATWMRTDFFRALAGYRVESGLSADMDLCWRAALVSAPRLFPEILSFAEEGGVSAQQGPGYYARAMRKNVKHSGESVLGVRWLDPVASAGVVALTSAVQTVPTMWARRQRP